VDVADDPKPEPKGTRVTHQSQSWLVVTNWPGSGAAEVERRFEELRRRWQPETPVGSTPPADVFVVGHEIWVEVDLPGAGEVETRIEAGELVIEARREIQLPGAARVSSRERSTGSMQRRLRLPHHVERPLIESTYEAGVLRIRVVPAENER
jgi:HSP20 family molecular chaperone IbpA